MIGMKLAKRTRYVFVIIRILFLIYVLFGFLVFVAQRQYIYFPNTQDFYNCPGFEEYQTREVNGTRFYYLPSGTDQVLVYYHGNAGSACDRSGLKDLWQGYGISMIFVEYTSYSNDDVGPSQKLILQDVENIHQFITDQGYTHVTVYGESVGSGPASYQTTLGKVDQTILTTPFSNLIDVAKAHYPVYPVEWLIKDRYPNEEWLSNYQGRILILHGDQDTVVSPEFSRKLYEAVQSENKQRVLINGADHNDVYSFDQFWVALDSFLIENN